MNSPDWLIVLARCSGFGLRASAAVSHRTCAQMLAAKAEAKRLVDEAKEALAPFGDRAAPLIGIADYIIERKN